MENPPMECSICRFKFEPQYRYCRVCGNDSQQPADPWTTGVDSLRQAYFALHRGEHADYPRALSSFAEAVKFSDRFPPVLQVSTQYEYAMTICQAADGGPLKNISTPDLVKLVQVLEEGRRRFEALPEHIKSTVSKKDYGGSIAFTLDEANQVLKRRGSGVAGIGSAAPLPSLSPPGKWDLAEPAFGQYAFEGILKLHVQVPHTRESLLDADNYGIGCLKCKAAIPLTACPSCGNTQYRLGLGTYGAAAILCSECRRGFEFRKCPKCGCENPVNHETLIRPTSRTAASKSSGCLIVTADSGDANSFEVLYLSEFRDNVLSKSSLGKFLVNSYYAVSPRLAAVIAHSGFLRKAVLAFGIRPLIFVLRGRRD